MGRGPKVPLEKPSTFFHKTLYSAPYRRRHMLLLIGAFAGATWAGVRRYREIPQPQGNVLRGWHPHETERVLLAFERAVLTFVSLCMALLPSSKLLALLGFAGVFFVTQGNVSYIKRTCDLIPAMEVLKTNYEVAVVALTLIALFR